MKNDTIKKILVVDDEAVSIFVAKKILSQKYEVEAVTNGYDALDRMQTVKFDMVLLDINLGDDRMDGIRVMRKIRQENKFRKTKLVAVTAYSDMRDWYISEGFDEFFMKPLIGPEILSTLDCMLDESTQRTLVVA